MNDYVRALNALKNLLPATALREFEVHQARLMENLHRERLFGETADTRAGRFAIVDALNQLAWQHHTKSFTELCFHPQTIKVSPNLVPPSNEELPTTASQQHLKKVVAPYYLSLNAIKFTISTTMPGIIGPESLKLFAEKVIETIEFLRVSKEPCRNKSNVIAFLEDAKIPLQIAIDEARPGGNAKRRYQNITTVGRTFKEALKYW